MSPEQSLVRNPLSLRLLRRLLLASVLCLLALTALRTLWEQHVVLAELDRALAEIGRIQAKPLAQSLWDYDRQQAVLHLEGICSLPPVSYAALLENGQIFAENGERTRNDVVTHEIPLERQHEGRNLRIGTLLLQADLSQARARILSAALRALAANALLVTLVGLVLFLLIREMISRHLSKAAEHFLALRTLGSQELPPGLAFDKKPAGDELDLLAEAVNAMQESRFKSIMQLAAAEHEARAQALFPEVNPNPVLRVTAEGVLVVANEASTALLGQMGCALGLRVPEVYLRVVQAALASGAVRTFEVEASGRVFAFAARPVLPDGFVNLYGMDITVRVRAEAEVRRAMTRLQCLVRVLQQSPASVQEFLDSCLDEALRLTESRLGYIYHYDETRREFTLNSWSKEVMHECAVREPARVYQLDKTGAWGEVVRQKRPLVLNDFPAENPLKRGFPEGHVALLNFMSVPVLREGRVVAVAGVANRPGGYGEAEVMELSLLMDACWQVVGRMSAEQDVLRSLHEKEILLKEIHHRVKNNMQVISSLLFLQMQHVVNDRDRELFAESQKRIQAMALVHEELYGSADLSSVDMREYIPRMVDRVVSGAAAPIDVTCEVDAVRLPVTSSIPCGLLLNELVMNAVKHAFNGRAAGRLLVRLARADGWLRLLVEDDGPGLPPGFDMASAETLGMTLVTSLAQQLGGRVEAGNVTPGARFCLSFPDTGT